MKKSLGAKTLIFPTPVWVVASYDKKGRPNAATVAWGGICNSRPPSVAVSLRKSRYSYDNIIDRKAFTLNVPCAKQIKIADYCGIASGKNADKFSKTGITAVKSAIVDAPYIQEFPMILECRLLNTFELGAHTQFVGEIMDVKVDENMLGKEGLPDILKIRPALFCPEVFAYHEVGDYIGRAFSIGKEIT
ncbi:MAG TPA: flavin reductase family protein [Deltaproteobacteria bacterium]|nr:flavin reductase family protein [Deltaproteobacteria bacterium]